jgi:hypothetical protein
LKNRVIVLSAVLFVVLLPLFLFTSPTNAGKLLASLAARTSAAQQGPVSPWPSIAEQLQKSGVRPGTALERLIRDNQELSLLRLDEATDLRRLPPWARVWWRKSHPELAYLASDPTGGYPLVLKEIVEWMMWHQDLKPGPGSPPAKLEKGEEESELERKLEGMLAPEATISGERRISGLQSAARSESDIRINFFDPTKILSGSNAIQSGGQQAMFFSTDSGTSWGQTVLPLISPDSSHSDPTVDWTSDGRGWSSTLGIVGSTLRMRNYVSTDNGANWVLDATPSGTQTSVDKQMVWVDHSPTSPFFNRMYAIWHNGQPAFMNRRTAGVAGTWLTTPIQVSGAESTGTAIGSDVKTNSAGDVFGFWPTTTNRRIFVVKSTNGGESYGAPVQIGTTFDAFDIGVPSFAGRRALIYVSGGTYRTGTKNLVYASWTDLSGDSGCTAAANEPGTNAGSACKTRIWFSRSTDGGATWSPAVKINNQAGLNDQFNQWLAVDETTGALGLMYYDTVADSGRKKVHVYYHHSFDDGVTWTAAQQVTTAQTDETTTGADSGNQFGDYNGLSAYAGILFPSWTDRRGGAREEIWTARINDPACTAPGAPTGTNAVATAANQVTVNWSNGAPAAAKYNVYRAVGTCESPGAFALIATNVPAANYVDTMVSGGTTYAYRITGLDETGSCESAPSACSAALATGVCTLPPTFAGLASVTNAATASCMLNLSWAAAAANCNGPVSYRIHRATTPGFTPGAGNLIATITATNYTDGDGLMNGVPYYYIVRAVDNSNSAADANTVEKSGTPTGPVTLSTQTETFEGSLSGGGFDNAGWTHQAISGGVDWVWSTNQSQTPSHSWFSDSQTFVSQRALVSPVFGANANTTLSFWHTFDFETNSAGTTFFDGGTLEFSTNGGGTWTVMPDANFTAGGFNATISTGFQSPIGGLRAWGGGTIGSMTQVTVNLASLAGSNVMLRWREGDDESAADIGWFVDSVTIANAGVASACTTGNGCPTITIAPPTVPGGGSIGTPYPGTTLTASGGTEPYAFSISAGALPTGLALSSTGVISGIPAAGGTFMFTVKATDTNGCMGTQSYTITVTCPTIGITPGSLVAGITGQLYSGAALAAFGGTVPYGFTLMSGTLPAGLSLSAAGVISGIPTETGNFTFVVRATDLNGCTGTQEYTLTIGCGTVSVNPATLPGTQAGLFYTQTISALPAGGNYSFTVTAGALPAGLSLNPATGVLDGTPAGTGTFSFTIQAAGFGGSCTGSREYSLMIGCPTISLSPTTLPNAQPGVTYSQPVTPSPAGSYTFALSNGSLPAGLSLNPSTGAISGTTTQSGSFSFRVTASGFGSCSGFRDYTLEVASCPALTVNPESLPNATSGVSYTQTFTQTGAANAPTWSISAGSLPGGLMLNPTTGVLAGTPTVFGLFNFTVQVADAGNCMGVREYALTVNPPCGAITVSPQNLANGFVGAAYGQALSATGGTAPYSFAVSTGSLPNGLALNSEGALSGTPTATGISIFTIQSTDANGCTGTREYTVVISGSGLMFYPLPSPVRLLDTRAGTSPTACSQPNARIPGGTSLTQPARGFCGLPVNAQAITGNITTVQSGGGYLTLYPSDIAQPLAANSNYEPNEILNNVFTVALGATGQDAGAFKIFVTSNTDVVVDVTGYFAPPEANGLFFHPLPTPIRLLETRAGLSGCNAPGAPLSGNADTTLLARLTCAGITIPDAARAIVGNATTVNPAGPGFPYLTLFPADAARPLVASSNYLPGQVINAPFTVGLSPAGEFKVYPTTQTDLVIDVLGYYSSEPIDANGAGLLFSPLPKPVRLLETRAGFTGCSAPGTPVLGGAERLQTARGLCDGVTIAATALGIVGNATVVNSNGGLLTFWPSNSAQPTVAASNFSPGQVFNRHFTVGLGGGDGAFKIFSQFTTDLVIDASGFFAP